MVVGEIAPNQRSHFSTVPTHTQPYSCTPRTLGGEGRGDGGLEPRSRCKFELTTLLFWGKNRGKWKVDSCLESPDIWFELSVLYHWSITTRQPQHLYNFLYKLVLNASVICICTCVCLFVVVVFTYCKYRSVPQIRPTPSFATLALVPSAGGAYMGCDIFSRDYAPPWARNV